MKKDKASVARRNRRAGRKVENRFVESLGMNKAGAYGGIDGYDDLFVLEVKMRKSFVGLGWLEQAGKHSAGITIPIAGFHRKGESEEQDLILMWKRDFIKLRDAYVEEHQDKKLSIPQKHRTRI